MNLFANGEQSRVFEARETVSGARIGHVNLRVADLDRAISFYCDVLGLSVSYYGPSIGVPTVFLAFDDYHHHVALNWFYRYDHGPKQYQDRGVNHFAILYPDEVSLAGAVDRLLNHGDLIDDARDHGGTLSIYLRDPDNNGIELYYDRPRTQWFDSAGELVIKSEPFDVRKWLKDVWAGEESVLWWEAFLTLVSGECAR
jgi:catechol 2,3-dioxygenase